MIAALMVLVAWSLLAAVWWSIAWWLLVAARRSVPNISIVGGPAFSVFKAIPATMPEGGHSQFVAAIESFVAQMDPGSEMLLGIPFECGASWRPIIERWSSHYPDARIKPVIRRAPEHRANPKIAWMEVLSAEASCDYWLWSDADIMAPPGTLDSLRSELQRGCPAATCAYRVENFSCGAGALDAIFINVEFLPGVLLLGARGFAASAFGAAVVFGAELFKARLPWEELGSYLADDFLMGRRLSPVRMSSLIVNTLAMQTRFVAAIRHYHRWHKTLRWCRPLSYASLLIITPMIGWICFVALFPSRPESWAGLAILWCFESAMATILLWAAGCRWPARSSWMLVLWPMIRCLVWAASWLPIPVVWAGARTHWTRLRANA